MPFCRNVLSMLLCVAGLTAGVEIESASASDAHRLHESATDRRVFEVEARLTVTGDVRIPALENQFTTHRLSGTATHRYQERRLPGAGRDAQSLRALRSYEQAESKIEVGEQTTSSLLPGDRRVIVGHGRRAGIEVYCPAGLLSRGDLDLLQMSGDSLAMLSLLPPRAVEVGETWLAETWALQMLTNTEVLTKGTLTCRLESVADQLARVSFQGEAEGATLGAPATLKMSGSYAFDLKAGHIQQWKLTQQETRTAGAFNPALDVEATVVGSRRLAATPGALSDARADALALEPKPEQLLLRLDLPWGLELTHDRDWHVYQMTDKAAVLRLIDAGSIIAACNITRLPAAAPGSHLSDEQFQEEVRAALGERLTKIQESGTLDVAAPGWYVYRVHATGQVKDQSFAWLYHLCADPNGRQVSFVLTTEPDLLPRLAEREKAMLASLRFSPARATPVSSRQPK